MRRAAKVDGNHPAIRDHLRAVGWSVLSLAAHGRGVGDLLVSRNRFTAMAEVKKDGKERLTADQVQFRYEWQGVYVVVTSPEDAEAQLKIEYEFAMSRPL